MSNAGGRTLETALEGSVNPSKALLTLVGVMDHNDVAHAKFPATFRPLTFHVLGFLLLPFVISQLRLSQRFIMDRLVRYWVPQFWILTISALLFWIMQRHSALNSHAARDYLLAIAIGSAPLVKASSGFLAYWFLPTMPGLIAVLALHRSAPARWRGVMLALFVAVHCMLVADYVPGYYWVPFGLAIVANVFVLGLLFEWIAKSRVAYAARWAFPVAFVISYRWLAHSGAWLEVAILQMAPLVRLATFIAQDVAGVSGVVTVMLLADRLKAVAAITSIRRLSLTIYLLHPLVYAALETVLRKVGMLPRSLDTAAAYGLFSYLVAVSVAWAGAALIEKSEPMSRWVTPRGWNA